MHHSLVWWSELHNSVKLWAIICRTTQDRWIIVKSSDKTVARWRKKWQPTPIFLTGEPHEQYEKAKRYDTRRESPRSEGVQYATGEKQKAITNSSRKNKAPGPKPKQHSVVDVSGGESKVWCYKEQYCIETWNVRSMNQGKLDAQTGDSKSEHQHLRN